MTIRTDVFVERNLMIHHVSDYVSLSSVLHAIQCSINNPEYHPGMNMVWFCETGTTIDIGSDEPIKASEFARKVFDHNDHAYKLALVAEDDLAFGLQRVYEGWNNDRPVDIRVFRVLDEALSWIEA